MKNPVKVYLAILFGVLLLPTFAAAQAGGQFAITQSVIAGGGANSNSVNFGVTGTAAQAAAGVNSTGDQFSVTGGFWQAFFAPTAALVSVSGKVTTANGFGIANVRVSMINQTGETQTAVSNSFGNFRFAEVPAGEIYVFTVHSRRYQFSVPSQVLSVTDNVSDLAFIADLK
jgi:hypothetical protein